MESEALFSSDKGSLFQVAKRESHESTVLEVIKVFSRLVAGIYFSMRHFSLSLDTSSQII